MVIAIPPNFDKPPYLYVNCEDAHPIHIPVLSPAIRAYVRDFGICVVHAVPLEMGG
jgi:hypothetical protein